MASVRDFVHDEAQERGWEGPGYGPGEEAHDAGTRPVAMWHKPGGTVPHDLHCHIDNITECQREIIS